MQTHHELMDSLHDADLATHPGGLSPQPAELKPPGSKHEVGATPRPCLCSPNPNGVLRIPLPASPAPSPAFNPLHSEDELQVELPVPGSRSIQRARNQSFHHFHRSEGSEH